MDAEKKKAPKEWSRAVELGGVFELVDSVNEYARRKGSIMAPPSL